MANVHVIGNASAPHGQEQLANVAAALAQWDIDSRYVTVLPTNDLGQGAGFYVNATRQPWSKHYHMYDYVSRELPALVEAGLPLVPGLRSISGHSMGGHGALICALKNPGSYRSVSAFAPICNPVVCGWGQGCFGAYLGDDAVTKGVSMKISSWQRHDHNTMPPASKTTGNYVNSSLAKVEALRMVGRASAAWDLSAELAAGAEAVGHPPLLAEVLASRGFLTLSPDFRGFFLLLVNSEKSTILASEPFALTILCSFHISPPSTDFHQWQT